ncbi:MAG: hypothetical protein UR89_C0029G0004 [Candidatus Roizmanbacteria bacterium GW2011_GWA2_35_8]|uniref:Uncharacterized protein n=1 Tax=Candidatus Roizmanbacteria bacterium GW2011_GWA2_35_8 TaxID=1618479 RepID=A0A0G0CWF9_9BACT|nr:MAG: hypothetical protein UR89_C0029G0004 [Candidatus Roizmanbacteria bacterium GW2011_GWA2_35_8]
MKTKLNLPKITLILIKNNQKRFIYPSIRKTQNFLRNKAESYLKNDYLITFKVLYKDGGSNSGTYYRISDLNWAYQAFIREYL